MNKVYICCLSDMELVDMTACSGLSVKQDNASSQGTRLWKTSCISYLGKYRARDLTKHHTMKTYEGVEV